MSLLTFAGAAMPGPARADFYLVVQAANSQRALTQKEAIDLFMGRQRAFPNGDAATVFDMPRDSPRRAAFYQALTGLSAAQVNSYWSRLMFSGQSQPPQPMANEAAMVGAVGRQAGALGWLEQEPADRHLRVVLVLKDPP